MALFPCLPLHQILIFPADGNLLVANPNGCRSIRGNPFPIHDEAVMTPDEVVRKDRLQPSHRLIETDQLAGQISVNRDLPLDILKIQNAVIRDIVSSSVHNTLEKRVSFPDPVQCFPERPFQNGPVARFFLRYGMLKKTA